MYDNKLFPFLQDLLCRSVLQLAARQQRELQRITAPVHSQETPHGNRHRRRVDYDRKQIESPAQKTFGIQDAPRGVSRLVKPCCSSNLNPPPYTLILFERKLYIHWPVRTKTPYTSPVFDAKLYIHWGSSSQNSIYIEPSLGHNGPSASAQKTRTVKRNDTGLQPVSQSDF